MDTVTDDLGYSWRFTGDHIVMDGDDSEPAEQRGYWCSSFTHGVALLYAFGYISAAATDEPNDGAER